MNELALFAGGGGGILGGKLLGWSTKCAVEIDPYARSILIARQADGCLEPFPIWDDITTFNGNPWRGRIDVVSGGFPCQDISAAGKGKGISGSRSGLWAEMARIVSEVQPTYVWVENSPMLTSRGLDRVLWDLAALGYNATWGIVSAENASATHERERIWVLAYPTKLLCDGREDHPRSSLGKKPIPEFGDCSWEVKQSWWVSEPNVGGMVDGVAPKLDKHGANSLRCVDRVAKRVQNHAARLKAIGNGQVPAAMVLAWSILHGRICEHAIRSNR